MNLNELPRKVTRTEMNSKWECDEEVKIRVRSTRNSLQKNAIHNRHIAGEAATL